MNGDDRYVLTTDEASLAAWLVKLARGSSWPGEMAERVERAAERVLAALEGDK